MGWFCCFLLPHCWFGFITRTMTKLHFEDFFAAIPLDGLRATRGFLLVLISESWVYVIGAILLENIGLLSSLLLFLCSCLFFQDFLLSLAGAVAGLNCFCSGLHGISYPSSWLCVVWALFDFTDLGICFLDL
ncbi:hypothetical protein KFK09_012238 [Dendrobium nobile]|uniref:Transmembrane protein n=1 Tax=Dendrobium nobile TaxID=94219 RepID=A0A8T3BK79_DENNO|nr:hypothetical protein KFK09_012238 [Dendrobium nobile]